MRSRGTNKKKNDVNLTFDLDDLDLSKNEGPGRSRGTNRKKHINLTFDLDDLDLSKNEPLKLIFGAALHLPSKFGEDRPKDLGGNTKKT